MKPWPCSTCGAPGVKNLGTSGHCSQHLADLYRSFDPAVFKVNGIGLQSGVMRPDFGPTAAELECVACDATWTGPIGERCPYCDRHRELLLRYQAELVLTPPEIEPDAGRYDSAMAAWARQLAHAVTAEIVTEQDARRALERRGGARHAA